jgi:hypothetical protein
MFRFTIRDVLWLITVVALATAWWTTRNELVKASVWRNRAGALEEVLSQHDWIVRYDDGVARLRKTDGSDSQTLLLSAFPPKSEQ